MVPDTPDVEKVLFGAGGVAEGLAKGKTVVDMSSISPIETKAFAKRINDLGCIPVGNTPEEFGAFLKADVKVLAEVFKANGVTAN